MREIAQDVWQLGGFPPHAINMYLAGDVLVDTGTRWAGKRIVKQLGARPLSLVALTHVHPDHQGSARMVCERNGVPLACHELDVPAMQGDGPMLPDTLLIRTFTRIWAGPSYPVARVLREGDRVGDFRVVHTPGHTPGHVVFFRERDRVAILGDLMNGMSLLTTWPGLHEPPAVFSTDLRQNRQSIFKLAELEPSLLCFGHGPPMRNTGQLSRFVQKLKDKTGS